MTKTEFVEYLMDKLSYAYCDNCGCDDDECDGCHRKYQNWKLAQHTAEEIADVAFASPFAAQQELFEKYCELIKEK